MKNKIATLQAELAATDEAIERHVEKRAQFALCNDPVTGVGPEKARQDFGTTFVDLMERDDYLENRRWKIIGELTQLNAPLAPLTEPAPQVAEPEGFQANPDYRTVRFNGEAHQLTLNQAIIVKLLYEAWQRGTPALGKHALLQAIEAETSRVCDSFKGSPLWGTLIISNRKPRGTYQLNLK